MFALLSRKTSLLAEKCAKIQEGMSAKPFLTEKLKKDKKLRRKINLIEKTLNCEMCSPDPFVL
jgi:hypothetical protein